MITIADELIKGTLITNKSDSECRNELFELRSIEMDFEQLTEFTFEYPIVSNKVRYAKRQIDNSIVSDLNKLITSVEQNPTQELVLYNLMKVKRATKPALQNIQRLIDDNNYYLKFLADKNARFGIDLPYFENIYVCNYLQRAIIWFALEFQEHFKGLIPSEKQISLEMIYVEYLQMAAPENNFIVPTKRINVKLQSENKQEPEVDINVEVDKMPTNAQIFFEEVQKYDFTSLPKISILDGNKLSKFITRTLSHDMPYVIAMIDYIGYPKYLKDTFGLNKEQIYKHIATALNNVSPRQVKGNFLVLKDGSKEDTSRYSAYQFINTVKSDYKEITD